MPQMSPEALVVQAVALAEERAVALEVERAFLRNVDVVITDEAGSNLRFENARQEAAEHPSALLHLLCDAHKKAKVAQDLLQRAPATQGTCT